MTIRELQKNMETDALIIFRNNHFLGQDILDEENRILSLTGFSGSAGTLVIMKSKAFLFVDGRYEIQAAKQTDHKVLTVIVENAQQNFNTWLKDNLASSSIAYNPWQISEAKIQKMKRTLPDAKWVPCPKIEPTKKTTAFEQPYEYAGQKTSEKVKLITAQLKDDGNDAMLICAADSVSWLLNLRSNALPETPIVRAMALVTAGGKITMFADNLVLPKTCKIEKLPLQKLETKLTTFAGKKIAIDFACTPSAVVNVCQILGIKVNNKNDLCAVLKAEKNPIELQGMINAHIKDGVAVCKFLAWFDNNNKNKSEMDVVEKLLSFRKKQNLFHSVSFATIAGSDKNAAIIHYKPTEKQHDKIKNNSVLLLDSGGQYQDGTTDITRTIAVGTPTKDMIEKFTIVLKAHIALSDQKFPEHTGGVKLDVISRSVMWQYGLDYKHGTGHGVGSFLNVHEGPQSISTSGNNYPLKPNMVVSIEPGYYKENDFGIRIENLVYVKKSTSGFLNFVPLTLVPIDFRLIDKYLLNEREIKWLNKYHKTVYKYIAPFLNEQERGWLERACSPL